METPHQKIKVAVEEFMAESDIDDLLSRLRDAVSDQDEATLREIIARHFDDIAAQKPGAGNTLSA